MERDRLMNLPRRLRGELLTQMLRLMPRQVLDSEDTAMEDTDCTEEDCTAEVSTVDMVCGRSEAEQ